MLFELIIATFFVAQFKITHITYHHHHHHQDITLQPAGMLLTILI